MKKSYFAILLISVVILSSVIVYSADAAGIPKKAISTMATFLKSDLPTTTVFNDQANTYTAGNKQTFQSSSTTAGANFAGVASDPSGVAAGDIWRNTASDALKVRGTSITQTIPTLESTETFTGTTTLNSLKLGGQMDLSGNTLKSSGHVYTFPSNTGTVLMTNGSGSSLTSIPTSITGTANNITASSSTGAITIGLGNSVVVNNLANTYTAGKKQTFQSSSTTAGLNFAGVASDPSGVAAGDVWRITGNDTFKVRGNSAAQTIHTTNALAQFSTFAGPTTAYKTLATPVMGGFNIQFTPQQTGRVLIEFTFNCITATKLDGCLVQPAYGTGTPPTGNSAITGTTVGSQYLINGNSVAASAKAGGSVSIVITGLTVGTQYWVDFQWTTSVTNVNAQISDVQAAIIEV